MSQKKTKFIKYFIIFFITSIVIGFYLGVHYIFQENPYFPENNYQGYLRESKVDNFKFEGFQGATKIIVVSPFETNLEEIVIKDPDNIDFAIKFIQKHSDGWVKFNYTKWNLLEILSAVSIEFYNDRHLLDTYEVKNDIVVYRKDNQIYWKYIPPKEMLLLIQNLEIPPKALEYPD